MKETLYLLNCITTKTAVNTYTNARAIYICLMNHGSYLTLDIKDLSNKLLVYKLEN